MPRISKQDIIIEYSVDIDRNNQQGTLDVSYVSIYCPAIHDWLDVTYYNTKSKVLNKEIDRLIQDDQERTVRG